MSVYQTCHFCAITEHSHVEDHVVRGPVPVCVCDVMDSAHRHDDLPHRVNDGQVDNGPVEGGSKTGLPQLQVQIR